MDKKEIQEMVDAFQGKVLNYNVAIREIPNINVTEAGLDTTMAVSKTEKLKKGIIVGIGSSCPKGDEEAKVGDTVLFDSYKATLSTSNNIVYTYIFYADLFHAI